MTENTCSNEVWAAENDMPLDWARWMWWCECIVCTPDAQAVTA